MSHRYNYNWKKWRTSDFSQYSKSYFHHILSLLSRCNQSHGAFELVGPVDIELFEMNTFEDIIFHNLRNFEMKEKTRVQCCRRKSGCDLNLLDRELRYIIGFFHCHLKEYLIFLFFALGLNCVLKFQLFNFAVWTGKSKQCWRWKE